MEQKAIAAQIEIKAEGSTGTFEGYCSAFNNTDSYGDVILPGAFSKTIAERKGKIKALYNHDAHGLPIGTPLEFREDAYGLFTVVQFSNTAFAQDVRTLMQEGAINTMSIGYSVLQQRFQDDDGEMLRYLTELKLYELSPVLFEANSNAIITGSKSVSHIERLITQLDNAVSVGIKSGRPLSAENLTRLQTAYKSLHALLSADPEPPAGTQAAQGAATADAEPPTHSDDLLPALKSFTPFPQTRDEAAVLAELKSAFAFIHQGA
jgi:hypothetical protein